MKHTWHILNPKGKTLKYNQIHKGEERQVKNKLVRKNQMLKKFKKRLKNEMGEKFFAEHPFEVKGKAKADWSPGVEYDFNFTAFKSTGSPIGKKKYKAWEGKKRKSEKQKINSQIVEEQQVEDEIENDFWNSLWDAHPELDWDYEDK